MLTHLDKDRMCQKEGVRCRNQASEKGGISPVPAMLETGLLGGEDNCWISVELILTASIYSSCLSQTHQARL